MEEPSGSVDRSRGMRENSRAGQQDNGPLSGFCRPAGRPGTPVWNERSGLARGGVAHPLRAGMFV